VRLPRRGRARDAGARGRSQTVPSTRRGALMRVVGVDIGGTFTDFMLYDTEHASVHVHKVPSTPAEPERAMVDGLVELCSAAGLSPRDVTGIFHGTTVHTNAVLQHQCAVAGLTTTRGMRAGAHIGRHERPLPS